MVILFRALAGCALIAMSNPVNTAKTEILLSERYDRLILKTEDVHKIKTLIPESIVSQKFQDVIYVPWTLQACQKLVRCGISITPPIEKKYSWAGSKKPYSHQIKQAGFCTLNKRGFILSGMGSGKTLSVLWALDNLIQANEITRVLILAKLSTLDAVWGDTLFSDFYHYRFAVLTGTAERRRKLFNDKQFTFYIINHDAFHIIRDEFLKRDDINALVIDESSEYKDHKSLRFKRLRNALDKKNVPYIWALTATPTPNKPVEAWPQARLLNLHRGYSYTQFLEMTMQKVSMFKWIPRPDAHKYVAEILSPSIRFETRECIDLPPTVYSTRKAQLSPEQRKAYNELMKALTIEFSTGVVNAVNEADKQNKLLQIACGFVYSKDATNAVVSQRIDPGPRLHTLDEVLEEIEGKIIIFVPYTELLIIIYEHLHKKRSCAIVSGQTSAQERYEIFTLFQKTNALDTIIAHPRTMAHGIDLTAAATIVWYAPYASNEIYIQANARIVRPKQTKTTHIIHIEATPLEKRLYNKLANKEHVQGVLLSYIKELNNGRTY